MDYNKIFLKELNETTIDTEIDYLELGLDQFVDGNLLSEIPIVKTIHSFYKVGMLISEQRFIKNIVVFLNEFHNGELSYESKQKFIKEIESKKKSKLIEIVLLLLEKSREDEIALIIAKLLKAYIVEEMDLKLFVEQCISLERLYIKDLRQLAILYLLSTKDKNGAIADDKGVNDSYTRLEYEGLIKKHINVTTYPGNSKYVQSFSIRDSAQVFGKVVQDYFKIKVNNINN